VIQQKPLLELYPESIGAQCIKAFVSNLVGATEHGSESEGLSEFWQRYLEEIAATAPEPPSEEDDIRTKGEEVANVVSAGIPGPIAAPSLHYDPSETSRPGEIAAAMFGAGGFGDIGASAPALLAPMLKRLNQGELSATDLRQLIVVDPGLTLQALRLSNLDEISTQGHIESLALLTDRLNEEDLQPMLLQAALRSGADDYGLQRWVDSYRCAVLAREISQAVSFGFPDEAYLGGLLLDVGRSADDQNDAAEGAADHAVRGAELLQTLGLNPMICDAVRFHHHPPSQVGTAFNLVRIVYAAHMLVHGADTDDSFDNDSRFIEGLIDLNAEQISELLEKAKEMSARTASWLDLDIAEDTDPESGVDKNGSLHGYLLDNLLTRTIMSPLSRPTSLEGWVRNFHRSCTLLAGIRRIICLVADDRGEYLKAVGFDGCFCAEHLENIVIPADNSTSLVSKVYMTGTPLIADLHEESSLNLGDRQLGRLLGGRTMICLPLKVDGKSAALMVYVPEEGQAVPLDRQMSTLLTLGTRAAEDLAALGADIS
jgi:HD-like signal output (HDOD) protein